TSIWMGQTSEGAPDWAVLRPEDIEIHAVSGPPEGPPSVNSHVQESVDSSQVEEPFRRGTTACPSPKRKAKGKQVPDHFVHELAWKCCQLKAIPRFSEMEKVDLQEEECEESMELRDDLGVYIVEDSEREMSSEEEDTTGMYVKGTKQFDEPMAAIDEPT